MEQNKFWIAVSAVIIGLIIGYSAVFVQDADGTASAAYECPVEGPAPHS